ncbi:hypothetical protein [Pseudobacteriovorax antillogorgiicola]|uniref:Uncharacterized protein n=1 Tax=Pseudobacteriovorax antillogorgiicola TaxID=1513793 RepID=A0A1Y6CDQ9_9BACT|nr:hypothetical protein [Pseudobacteriovorax antillogorgiicola]TCS47991.1 hypothetical protein EDD56_119102 [Pseudobacteriovorax antillogorgiicola]SMF58458.1 hypothetical protein SAMN06296036_119103 [Pseudobacteriovorax antillogorgiicola]
MQMFMEEAKNLKGVWRLLRRSPLSDDLSRFDVLEGSQYQVLISLVGFATLVEIPLIHFIIQYLWEPSPLLSTVQIVIVAMSLYGIIWFLGDYQRIKEGGYHVYADGIHIDISSRWQGSIPFSAIKSVSRSNFKPKSSWEQDWRKKQEQVPEGLGRLSIGLEKPNVCIRFQENRSIKGLYGIERSFNEIHFYVSNPDQFLTTVSEKLKDSCIGRGSNSCSHQSGELFDAKDRGF